MDAIEWNDWFQKLSITMTIETKWSRCDRKPKRILVVTKKSQPVATDTYHWIASTTWWHLNGGEKSVPFPLTNGEEKAKIMDGRDCLRNRWYGRRGTTKTNGSELIVKLRHDVVALALALRRVCVIMTLIARSFLTPPPGLRPSYLLHLVPLFGKVSECHVTKALG